MPVHLEPALAAQQGLLGHPLRPDTTQQLPCPLHCAWDLLAVEHVLVAAAKLSRQVNAAALQVRLLHVVLLAAHAAGLALVHCTQAFAAVLQTGVAGLPLQCASRVHATQRPPAQTGVPGVPVHCESEAHRTHAPAEHTPVEHTVPLAARLSRHADVPMSQVRVLQVLLPATQAALLPLVHCMHVLVPVLHAGVAGVPAQC